MFFLSSVSDWGTMISCVHNWDLSEFWWALPASQPSWRSLVILFLLSNSTDDFDFFHLFLQGRVQYTGKNGPTFLLPSSDQILPTRTVHRLLHSAGFPVSLFDSFFNFYIPFSFSKYIHSFIEYQVQIETDPAQCVKIRWKKLSVNLVINPLSQTQLPRSAHK